MKKKVIHTPKAPNAIGPYSQAIQAGNLIFISGQIPIDPATGDLVGGDIRQQTRRILENIKHILESQGLTLDQVVKTTLFLKDLGNFVPVNEVYATYFPADPPARSTVEVARLPKNVDIEIEAVAFSHSFKGSGVEGQGFSSGIRNESWNPCLFKILRNCKWQSFFRLQAG